MGFETRFLNDRATLDVTHYRKRTEDALIDAIVAAILRIDWHDRSSELGAVQNNGWKCC